MNTLNYVVAFFCCSTLLFAGEPELKTLFDGKNLDAWEAPKFAECWQVKDGVLVVKNNEKKKTTI